MSDYMSKSYGKGGGEGGRTSVPTSVDSPRNGPEGVGGAWKPTQSSPKYSGVSPWAGGTSGPGKPKKNGM